jgi:hypothetical protein
VEKRFELAQKPIALFHTGVSEDFLLKNKQFEALPTKLLKAAAGFYADLEKLLAGQTDAKSRQRLAAAYFQLGELMDKIGDRKQALAVQRALDLWAKLAHLDIEMQVERALALLAGLGGDARSSVTAAEARSFADKSVAALAEAVRAGWALPSELREPDFDALRRREDFQKLLAEVDAKAGPKAKPKD